LEIVSGLEEVPSERLSVLQSLQIIRELERRKDFEIHKDQISEIEMKRPPGIFRVGHVIIRVNSGEPVKVGIAKPKEYERLQVLLDAFYPEVLRETR